ncbi:MAG: hypothetical protein AAF411_12100 [Myxococcota bacterium]
MTLVRSGILVGALVCFGLACDLQGTGGEVVEVSWSVHSTLSEGRTIQIDDWSVELDEARIALGPVYAFAPPPFASMWQLFGPSRALAHAGDDNTNGVRVIAELLDQRPVDLMAGGGVEFPLTLAEGGTVDFLNIVFDEPRFQEVRDAFGSSHAIVSGTATRGEDSFRFQAALDSTIPDGVIGRRVEGLPAFGELEEGTRISITVDALSWVRSVRFEALFEDAVSNGLSAEDVLVVEEPSQFHNAWYLNLRDPRNWTVDIESPEAI